MRSQCMMLLLRRRSSRGLLCRRPVALSSSARLEDEEAEDYAASSSPLVLDVMAARGLRSAHEIPETSTVMAALRVLTERRVGSALITRDSNKVSGVFTARDILRWLHEQSDDIEDAVEALKAPVLRISTPAEKLAWCAPRDPLTRVRVVMRALGVRNLPVVCTATGAVLGLLTANDVADDALERSNDAKNLGGKDTFLRATHGRSGLPTNAAVVDTTTRMSLFAAIQENKTDSIPFCDFNEQKPLLTDDVSALSSDRKQRKSSPRKQQQQQQRREDPPEKFDSRWTTLRRLTFEVGAKALPNPLKLPDGSLANSRRDKVDAESFRNKDDGEDLSEDAYFIESHAGCQYAGVFDGVGSWRKVGVDPRKYPRALRDAVVEALKEESDNLFNQHRPHDLLSKAWRKVTSQTIPGSSTACVLTLDREVNALSYVNLGDAGIVVFRDLDISNAGSTASVGKSTKKRKVVLVAPQQLRDFNLPYQLGWTNAYADSDDGHSPKNKKDDDRGAVLTFETPAHANVASFPVQPGDIIVVASDGLFDNVFLDDIADILQDWETTSTNLDDLANRLSTTARNLSLEDSKDSPFALLAKENDIMWGGGMPDDVTVVVLRVAAANNNNNEPSSSSSV